MDNRSTSYLTVAAVTVAAGLAVYAVYFDYKRRNDAEFRKKLKKEKKRVQKVVAETKQNEASASASSITPAALREAIQQIRTEASPTSPEEQEHYFMAQVAAGEKLALEGPSSYLPAAMAFFRALRVYPSPVELIVIYEKTIIEPVFKLIMDLTQLDVKHRIEAYYDFFPPKRMNVSVEVRETTQGQGARQVLVVNKDFAAGEVIYKEFPVITALDADLQTKGTHCSQCLRSIEPEMSLQLPKDTSTTAFHLTYCSKASPPAPVAQEARREAQTKFADFIKKSGKSVPLLVARFIARQVQGETQKLVQATHPGASAVSRENDSLTPNLAYLEMVPSKEEADLLVNKYATLTGKMAYNSFGVCFGGGRDDKPEPTARPEDVEKTRTPYGTQRKLLGTAEIAIVANRDLKKGDVLTIAFVDVTQHADESVIECRRRRRIELARGWRFSCGCERCVEEGKTMTAEEKGSAGDEQKDESKVEDSVRNYSRAAQAEGQGDTID
ncbi:MAS20-domain-containing protein [Pholiota molesta]|nr:MAS20-domain-containing protein [Pholiota molesta]